MSRHIQRADPNSVRRWNEFAVISALREFSPQRISSLTGMTGLTPAPLAEVLRGLVAKEWVDVVEPVPGGMGRPAQQYALHIPAGTILGIDVGAHRVRVISLTLAGQEVGRAERLTGGDTSVENVSAVIVEAVAACQGDRRDEVWLSSVALSGFLDPDGTLITSTALPQWRGLQAAEVLAGLLPGRVVIQSNVRAASTAELKVGAAQGIDDFVTINLGRRPAIGLVIDGIPRSGSRGVAGAMADDGIVALTDDTDWIRPFAGSEDPLGLAVRAAVAGDEAAAAGIVAHVREITPALRVATSLVDPELAIVVGALAPAANLFIEELAQGLFISARDTPPLVVSPLDEYGAALGAALGALWFVEATLSNSEVGALPFTLEELGQHPIPTL